AMVNPGVGYVRPYLALKVGANVLLERHILKIAEIRVWLEAPVASTLGYRLGLGVLLSEDAAEELLLRRLPGGLAVVQQVFDATPHRIPVAQRLATMRLIDGLHVIKQVRAGVQETSHILWGHLVSQAQG